MNKKAFTLIELLVVISIIALLMSVLMPAMRKAREQAKTIVCQSRHKQLATGINMYVTENAGYYPSNYIDRVNNKDYRYYNLIAGYLDVEEKIDIDNLGTARFGASDSYLFRCTTQDYITKALNNVSEYTGSWDEAFVSPKTGIAYHGVGSQIGIYGYNRFFRGENQYRLANSMSLDPHSHPAKQWKASQVMNASRLPLLCCSNVELGYAGTTDYNGATSGAGGEMQPAYPNPIAIDYGWPKPGRGRPKVLWGGPAPIHNGKMVYSMADGSVQKLDELWPYDKDDTSQDFAKYFHPIGKGIQ